MLAVAVVGMSIGCDSNGISGLTVNEAEKTETKVEPLTGGRTPPRDPDDDGQAAECLSSVGADDDNGRVHNRFLWCKRGILHVLPWEKGQFTDRVTTGSLDANYSMVGYGRDDGERSISVFLRIDRVTVLMPDGTAQRTTPLKATVRCPSSGCTVPAPTARLTFGAWEGLWIEWTVESSALMGGGSDAVSWHDWFFELEAEFPNTNVPDLAVLQASNIRCDSAPYFRGRPAACVFWDVLPHLQYSLIDPRTQEAVAHIQCAFSPSTCSPIYPDTFPIARTPLRGQYPGPRDLGLHRIPSAGMVAGNTQAASNRAEALRACTRVGRYALPPAGQYPGLPTTDYPQAGKDCDEYPFASTEEGALASAGGFPQFSVRAVSASPNRCAGSALGRFYRGDRILYQHDGFFVEILNGPSGAADQCDFATDEDTAVAVAAEEVPSLPGFFGGGGPVLGQDVIPTPEQVLSVDAGPDASGFEGARLVLSGFVAYASSVHWSYEPVSGVDPGTTCTFDAPTSPVTRFTCTDDGTFRVTLTASNASEQRADSALVTLSNQAPELRLAGPTNWQVFRAGTPVNLTAPFKDAGANDTHTCTVDWDDGTRESYAASNRSCDRVHTFASPGMYTLNVNVTDDDGGTGNSQTMVIAYDPEGGFVTAGGHFDSPAGALGSAPDVADRGRFEFNPKYGPHDTGPVPGQGKFQFHLDGTTFDVDATAFEWLVVTPDHKAALKGVAKVAAQSGFGFIAYGNDDPDQFRLIVWALQDGPNPPATPLYDSHRGARHDLDMAEPAPLAAGSIQIHQ
jgi:hypothetical protein